MCQVLRVEDGGWGRAFVPVGTVRLGANKQRRRSFENVSRMVVENKQTRSSYESWPTVVAVVVYQFHFVRAPKGIMATSTTLWCPALSRS
jgi:hypothetical protein